MSDFIQLNRDDIIKNYIYLREHLKANEIIPYFIQNELINLNESETILSHNNSSDKNDAFLRHMLNRGPNVFPVLRDALVGSKSGFVLDRLQETRLTRRGAPSTTESGSGPVTRVTMCDSFTQTEAVVATQNEAVVATQNETFVCSVCQQEQHRSIQSYDDASSRGSLRCQSSSAQPLYANVDDVPYDEPDAAGSYTSTSSYGSVNPGSYSHHSDNSYEPLRLEGQMTPGPVVEHTEPSNTDQDAYGYVNLEPAAKILYLHFPMRVHDQNAMVLTGKDELFDYYHQILSQDDSWCPTIRTIETMADRMMRFRPKNNSYTMWYSDQDRCLCITVIADNETKHVKVKRKRRREQGRSAGGATYRYCISSRGEHFDSVRELLQHLKENGIPFN